MTDSYWSLLLPLLRGLIVTIELAGIILLVGTVCGVVGGVLSAWGGITLRILFGSIIFVVRGIPLLVQVFIVFYLLPFMGLTLSAFVTATIALSVFASATIMEIVRGGIEAVPHGQTEAAMAVGFSRGQSMYVVVLPQAMMSILPPLITQFVFLVKATSIISLLGVPEIMLSGREVIERTLLGFEVMTMIWLLYTAICYPLTMLGRHLEAVLSARGFQAVKN